VLAPAPVAAALRAVRPPWTANVLALAALRACARRADARAALAERVAAARERLAAAVARLPGVQTWPAAANFLLLRVPDGPRVHAALLHRRIAVRPCGTFPGLTDDYLRITVRDPQANDRLVARLAEALA
jgi:histidinol-phosphate/aromatic aminotransferase/cobyric acid decarboxylase-like protein